jgi:hypothetical protein
MSNFNLANSMIRPRVLYISTSDAIDAFNPSSCRINLSDAVIPEDGFSLVAGLRSFGFNAQAWNISEEQKNNRLDLICTYKRPEFVYDSNTQTWIDNPEWENPTPVNPSPTNNYQEIIEIILPEGLYQTLEELLLALSQSDGGVYLLPSGFLIDRTLDNSDIKNIIPMKLNWRETSYGFLIEILPNDIEIDSIQPTSVQDYTAYDTNSFLRSIEIVPNTNYPLLYQMLFTNNIQNVSPSVPMYEKNKSGSFNPPKSIFFRIDDPLDVSVSSSEYTPWSQIYYNISEKGNEKYLDSINGVYQLPHLPYSSLPWKSFSTPKINPDYIDIACTGLPTSNLTASGYSSNLLHRQFLQGANQGLEAMFVQFDTPIWYRLENRDQISALTFQFSTEENRWSFFNMSFNLEIVFFEVPDETSNGVENLPPVGADEFTEIIQKYTNHAQNPYPYLPPVGRDGVVQFSASKKRNR